jgi:ATP-dependent exoDNAse (exonuclease V) beta subunit
MPSPNKVVVIAAAGSRKTEHVVVEALKVSEGRVLIATYTDYNKRQILERIKMKVGVVPDNIEVVGWFSFLLSHGARPYQSFITGEAGYMTGFNFVGEHAPYVTKSSLEYFFDDSRNIYRNGVSDFVCMVDDATQGLTMRRLESIYSHIFIDEIQDLVGFDLDLLDKLLDTSINIALVGDPRQHTFETSTVSRNRKYKKVGQLDWFEERREKCSMETRVENYRCNQAICDFADSIFPDLPKSISKNEEVTGHDGVFAVKESAVLQYIDKYSPQVLRYNMVRDTMGLPAMNIGVSKGGTFDRVLIFPTKAMAAFFEDGDATKLTARESLYVAVTRARYSVAFVA